MVLKAKAQLLRLQALEAFVATQRVLLARQRADIEALQRLKNDLVQRPSQVISHLSEEVFHVSLISLSSH
jgi:hypothetical protein